jgi:hypothetical protein
MTDVGYTTLTEFTNLDTNGALEKKEHCQETSWASTSD